MAIVFVPFVLPGGGKFFYYASIVPFLLAFVKRKNKFFRGFGGVWE
jgi:hypothetical protein